MIDDTTSTGGADAQDDRCQSRQLHTHRQPHTDLIQLITTQYTLITMGYILVSAVALEIIKTQLDFQ